MRPSRPSLTRELSIVLAVKLALLIAIRLLFFSDALRPESDAVARVLLAPPSPAASPISSMPDRSTVHE